MDKIYVIEDKFYVKENIKNYKMDKFYVIENIKNYKILITLN